jgi:hypothetical protein
MKILMFRTFYALLTFSPPKTTVDRHRSLLPIHTGESEGEGKLISLQAWTGPEGSRRFRPPDFNNRHMKVVRSALRTGRLYPPGIIPGTHFC